ncbi:MAG: hypothetical protein OXP12_02485 [Thaumarchaeota archaeon]|nr:hypothetical protein [Nitrososphaerota archaeon]
MGDISLEIDPVEIRPNAEIRGVITVSYPGKYDGVVVSAQISDSNEHITYKSSNGRPISQNVARLFIGRDTMKEGGRRAEFTAAIGFEPESEHEVKFRVSAIEQHKEIDSCIVFARYAAAAAEEEG